MNQTVNIIRKAWSRRKEIRGIDRREFLPFIKWKFPQVRISVSPPTIQGEVEPLEKRGDNWVSSG